MVHKCRVTVHVNAVHFILGAVQLKLAQDDHKDNEQDLRKDKRSLKVC